jgi:hypothetical protein
MEARAMTQEFLSERERLFFETVRTMPFVEAEQELRARRQRALQDRLVALVGKRGHDVDRANLLITFINDELHRLGRINRDHKMQLAVRALFGDEGWEQVKVWMHEHSPDAT